MNIMSKNRNMDLTEGSISKKLIYFALPLLATSLLQQLYNTVDLLFVGNFLPKESYAAVGSSSLLVVCMVTFFNGMSVGSSVVISHAVGSKEKERVHNSVHTAMMFSIISGIILTILGWLGTPLFLKIMNTAPEIVAEATTYLRIYILSLTSIIAYNMAAGMIRAMGNSNTPMIIQFVGGIANILGDIAFLYLFPGVAAVAWATMLSQSLSALLAVLYLMRKGEEYQLHLNKMKIHWETLKTILKIGVPAGMQNLAMTFSNMIAQYHINSLGVDAIASFTTYFKVELLLYHPIIAMGQAMTTFVAQNKGAGKAGRIKKSIKISIIVGIGISVCTAVLLLLLRTPLLAAFNNDANVVSLGIKIISVTFPLYWVYNIMEILADTTRGMGYSMPPMYIFIGNICVLRIILLFAIVANWHDVRAVAVTYPITWITTSVCFIIYYKMSIGKELNVKLTE